jgi:hypothetical protein
VFDELEEAWYTANDDVGFGASAYTIRGKNLKNIGAVISVRRQITQFSQSSPESSGLTELTDSNSGWRSDARCKTDNVIWKTQMTQRVDNLQTPCHDSFRAITPGGGASNELAGTCRVREVVFKRPVVDV